MNEKQVLIVPPNNGLSRADRDALREAGILVVTVRTPHEARLLSAERLPIDSNAMLRAVMGAVAASTGGYSEALRLQILAAIAKAIVANNEAA